VEWRAYRIPAAERKKAVARNYMAVLRKHVRTQATFLHTVRTAVRAERELASFLKGFGADDTSMKDSRPKVAEAPQTIEPIAEVQHQQSYWHASEERLLQLIAFEAQGLVDVEPFKYHPANLDLPEGTSRGPRGRSCQVWGDGAPPIALGRFSRKADKSASSHGGSAQGRAREQQQKGGAPGRPDVDTVFDRFTPRLREITEETMAEYRTERTGGDKDVLVLGLANATQLPSTDGA